MGFKKEIKNKDQVVWKRFERPALTPEEITNISNKDTQEAKKLPTEEKRIWFYKKIDEIKEGGNKEKILLIIDRNYFLRDSFNQFSTVKDLDLRGEIKIHFIDELAQDAGGLIREWFSVIVEELMNPSFGLFVKANTHELSYIINENSEKYHSNHLEYFQFCGQIFAKALFDRIPIKGYFNKTIFKILLGIDLVIEDMRYYDQEFWNSILFFKSTVIKKEEKIAYFTVIKKDPITQKENTLELKSNGKEIIVDDVNKNEFMQLFFDYHVRGKVSSQITQFLNGFYSLIPLNVIGILDIDEIELFICGDNIVDVEDWKKNTIYKKDYDKDHQIIKWFWAAINKLAEEDKRKFLQFCTGSTRVPAEGFKGLLSNSGKVCTFCIEPADYSGPETSFIVAHTCFNRIELPLFPDMKSLEDNIRHILNNPHCNNFTFE